MKLLWKIKLDSPAREMHNLFPPIILSGVATPNGRKSWRSPRESAMICSPSTQRPGNRFGTSTTTPTPAVLHTLQGAMGKSLWSSGQTIASYADASLSASQGHVYVVAHDHTFYAFGFYVPTDK
jgi:hypothetical protein